MSAAPRVTTPVSVGRFVAGIRSAAASTDGLAVCTDCRRQMSDMAETCPHCESAVTGRIVVAPAEGADISAVPPGIASTGARSMLLLVLGLIAAAYVIARAAGL